METPSERLLRYLQDVHALEVGALQAIDNPIADNLGVNELTVVADYRTQIRLQADAIEQRLTQLGATPSKIKGFVNGFLGAASEWIDIAHDPSDRTVMSIIRYYGLAQTKAATYEALTAYAKAANDDYTLQMAQAHQATEQATADQLFDLIPQFATPEVALATSETR